MRLTFKMDFHLIYNKGGKDILWGKDSLFNKWCWEKEKDTCKKQNGPLSYTIYKNKFKWIKDLNDKPETTKFLENKWAVNSLTMF